MSHDWPIPNPPAFTQEPWRQVRGSLYPSSLSSLHNQARDFFRVCLWVGGMGWEQGTVGWLQSRLGQDCPGWGRRLREFALLHLKTGHISRDRLNSRAESRFLTPDLPLRYPALSHHWQLEMLTTPGLCQHIRLPVIEKLQLPYTVICGTPTVQILLDGQAGTNPTRQKHLFRRHILPLSNDCLNDWIRGCDWHFSSCPLQNARNKIKVLLLVFTRRNPWHSITLVPTSYLQSDLQSTGTVASPSCESMKVVNDSQDHTAIWWLTWDSPASTPRPELPPGIMLVPS